MRDPKGKIPRIVEGVAILSLPIGPIDGFVYTRIDGTLRVEEIAEMSGLGLEQVEASVATLMRHGAVVWLGGPDPGEPDLHEPDLAGVDPARPALSSPRPPALSSGAMGIEGGPAEAGPSVAGPAEAEANAAGPSAAGPSAAGPNAGGPNAGGAAACGTAPTERPNSGHPQSAPMAEIPGPQPLPLIEPSPPPEARSERSSPRPTVRYDPAELEGAPALSLEQRTRVLEVYYSLERVHYYGLLGVPIDAARGAVRSAYFEISKQFHPDSFFGVELGHFKMKMEAIFKAMTAAYETLGKKKSRAAYDAYLRSRETAERLASTLALETPEAEPSAPPGADAKPPSGAPSRPAPKRDPAPSPPPASRPAPRAPDPRGRGQHFARVLRSATAAASEHPSSSSSAPPQPMARQEVLRGLTGSLREAASHTGGVDAIGRRIAEARRAEASGDVVRALEILRAALTEAPDRPELRAEHDRLRAAFVETLADTFRGQAIYEEEQRHWGAAALSWARVADGRPDDAEAARRTAQALLQAHGDLRRARLYAQRAVDLAPDDFPCRLVLGRVYAAAGKKLNALRELEAALQLDPSDEIVKNLLREVREVRE